jgi:hypothetical protein
MIHKGRVSDTVARHNCGSEIAGVSHGSICGGLFQGYIKMIVRRIMITVTFAALAAASGLANAACTQEDLMAKATKLSQLIQTKMAQDPSQGQALMAKLQPIMQAQQTRMASGGAVDMDKVCGEYDDMIKQAQ